MFQETAPISPPRFVGPTVNRSGFEQVGIPRQSAPLLIGQPGVPPQDFVPLPTLAKALVVALISLVYCLPPVIPSALAQSHAPALEAPQSAQGKKNTAKSIARTPLDDLPIPVQEMRDAILNAALRGDIEELRGPIEWNELRPEFAIPRDADPIAHWRKQSSDGHGRDILAILANLLASAPARLPLGADLENNDVFVWPYLSEISPGKLTPAQHVELLRIAPSAEVASMIARDKWTWYRLVIAADGTWHIFSKGSQSNLSEK